MPTVPAAKVENRRRAHTILKSVLVQYPGRLINVWKTCALREARVEGRCSLVCLELDLKKCKVAEQLFFAPVVSSYSSSSSLSSLTLSATHGVSGTGGRILTSAKATELANKSFTRQAVQAADVLSQARV